jgi:hypothetical protein
MRTILLLIFILGLSHFCISQNPYTLNNYSVSLSEPDLIYGVETNFAGLPNTLRMDIYKPIGDLNCQRPLMILVHGGSWIAGSKYDSNILFIAQEMTKKGYVVAAINYRLGMHKTSNYTMYWACNNSISAPCAYINDSSEIIRGIYRGMQDVKGAIRFMKGRAELDSTDINNVYLAGESAGGFNVLAAAFMRNESQKPADCYSIHDASVPDADLLACLPVGFSLSRPDLGSVEGNLHIGLLDSKVKGVANFYGGIMDPTLIGASVEKPAMYLFHQGSDVVVDYTYNRLLGRINWECYAPTNICQPYPHTPFAFGSEGIRRQLDSLGTQAPFYQADIIYNYNYMNDCAANGHSIDNIVLRTQHMADLFSVVIDSSGNVPPMNCSLISVPELSEFDFVLYPNPTKNKVSLQYSKGIQITKILIKDLQGRMISEVNCSSDMPEILFPESTNSGMYFLEICCDKGRIMKRVILQSENF